LAQGLAAKGHKITVIFADRFGLPNSDKCQNIHFESVHFHFPKLLHFPILSKIINSLRLSEKLRFHSDSKQISDVFLKINKERGFDIVESPNNGSCFHKLRSQNFKSCIRIATTDKDHSNLNHSTSPPYLNELFIAEGKTFHDCANLVTHTKAHRDKICQEYNLNSDKFTIIPLAVRIPESYELENSYDRDSVKVLFVGRFEPRKGIDIVLNIIPKVLLKNQNVEFILVGPDYENKYQKEFLKKFPNLRKKVVFKGEKKGKALEQEYKDCDIFLAPSRYESFGLIYAEAMSFSKPVIGTNIGGIPEVVNDGITGFLCEQENISEFAEKILLLTRNQDLRAKMGELGRKRAIENFDFINLVNRTESYYLQIVNHSKN